MRETHPGLIRRSYGERLQAPERLKVARVEPDNDTVGQSYTVFAFLDRKLTDFEVDALRALAPIDTPAGMIYPHHDQDDQLNINRTSVERVAENKKALVDAVASVEEQGERFRREAERKVQQERDRAVAAKQELERRKKLASEINFD